MVGSILLQEISSIFERERGRLIALAYAFLGSHSDAEDVVQEAWLRLANAGEGMRTPEAWLTTAVSRLALDRLRSAQRRRESYSGVWLPEPVSELPDPESRQEIRSTLSIGFLHLLERLSPEERAAFVLREAFDRSFAEIADTLGKTEAACRQLLSRARKRLDNKEPRRTERVSRQIAEQCLEALVNFDEQKLLTLLAADAVFYGDSGGRVPSALNPIYGADKVVRFFAGLVRKYGSSFQFELTQANGEPAILVKTALQAGVLSFRLENGKIAELYQVSNPAKLAAFLQASEAERV